MQEFPLRWASQFMFSNFSRLSLLLLLLAIYPSPMLDPYKTKILCECISSDFTWIYGSCWVVLVFRYDVTTRKPSGQRPSSVWCTRSDELKLWQHVDWALSTTSPSEWLNFQYVDWLIYTFNSLHNYGENNQMHDCMIFSAGIRETSLPINLVD